VSAPSARSSGQTERSRREQRHETFPQPAQLDFEALLSETDQTNANRALERKAAHLPATMDEAVPFFRSLIAKHHAAMLTADFEAVSAVKAEAELLAQKLNGFEIGYLAGPDAPGCVLDRRTRARKGKVPLWGQSGTFEITVSGTRIRIALDGMFGIAHCTVWGGFAAHAIDWDKPFISETGYRSFLGVGGDLAPEITPDAFAEAIIAEHIRRHMKGKLVAIDPKHRERSRPPSAK
jgi:hypothetical protein